MIGYLKGKVLDIQDGKMLVGVGAGDSSAFSGMVGYSVNIPQSSAYPLTAQKQVLELFIYTHVREDSLDLYGFLTAFEKTLFLLLLGVNGIGPKSALGILSSAEPTLLLQAIIRGDQAYLTRMPGIGKKTAERVVLELRDSAKKQMAQWSTLQGAAEKLNPLKPSGEKDTASDAQKNSTQVSQAAFNAQYAMLEDVRAALVGLGYREQQVEPLLMKALGDSDHPSVRTEDVIRTVLRQLAP